MTNWELLTFIEKTKILLIETVMMSTKSQRKFLEWELKTYKIYRKALRRKQRSESLQVKTGE